MTLTAGPMQRLWSGGTSTEGPVWMGDGLIWSDIPSDRPLHWDASSGVVTPCRHPSNGANGNTRDRQDRLVTCQGKSRRITRAEPDDIITQFPDRYQDQRFNAPNDVVMKFDGTIWFTDPRYGSGTPEMTDCHAYRLDPVTHAITQMTHDMVMPNSLAFLADQTLLYIVDTGSTHHPDGPNHIHRFPVGDHCPAARSLPPTPPTALTAPASMPQVAFGAGPGMAPMSKPPTAP